MGAVSSVLDPDNRKINIPDGYVIPSFPSLYNPTLKTTSNNLGYFLYDAQAIWRFTFYWTLILMGSAFLACSTMASINLLLSLTVFRRDLPPRMPAVQRRPDARRGGSGSGSATGGGAAAARAPEPRVPFMPRSWRPAAAAKRPRPSLWLVALIPLVMCSMAAFVALISGTVVGFALAAIYSAGNFSMSTWVPFLWACIQVSVLIVSSYSTLTRIL